MQVRVLFFGILKDLVGKSSESLALPDHATLSDLLAECEQRNARIKDLLSTMAIAVNQHYASSDHTLNDGDEVALLPPVSGGISEEGNCRPRAAIVREPIDTAALLNSIKLGEDGAAVVFEGVVRNNTRGRRTLYLDYEAYETMALKQLEDLATRAMLDFKIREISIVHRLGRLEVGQTSVAIVVVSAHRAAAFEACRWVIDTLKKTVPIWKKEYFEDGAVWADGEPFPAEIPRPKDSHSAPLASK